jgi:hypothetical protein
VLLPQSTPTPPGGGPRGAPGGPGVPPPGPPGGPPGGGSQRYVTVFMLLVSYVLLVPPGGSWSLPASTYILVLRRKQYAEQQPRGALTHAPKRHRASAGRRTGGAPPKRARSSTAADATAAARRRARPAARPHNFQ